MFTFRKAQEKDAVILTVLSKAAFDTDVTVGSPEPGGPPQYDAQSWHLAMIREGHAFVLEENGAVLAGAILFEQGNTLYIGRIFVNPAYFRCGIGTRLMSAIEKTFSHTQTVRFSLDTPAWNLRTNRFYQKCGYRVIRQDADTIYYEKLVTENAKA